MDINTFKRILAAFADEPSDVDIRIGKIVAQIRDEVLEATIHYSSTEDQSIRVVENGQEYAARTWLVNRVARLPQLADRIIAQSSQGNHAASDSNFVIPTGQITADLSSGRESDDPVSNVVETLLDRASRPMPGATAVLYLTSDAGEGKTTLINRAAYLQAGLYKQKKVSSLIVPIPLSGRTFLTFDDAVIAGLVNKLRFNYLYFDAFIELVRLGVVVPAFDGYEEMLVEGSKGEAISALGNFVQRLDSSGTILIAARKAFFEYVSFRTQARLLDAIGDRSAAFSRLKIARWDKRQFCEYGRLRGVDAPEAIFETVAARLGEAHPLLTRAVLVRRLFDVLDGAVKGELTDLLGANPHDYFFTFVDAIVKREASEKWLARVTGEVTEPLLSQNEHHQLLSQIALEMWQSSSNSLRLDVLDVVVDLFCEAHKKSGTVTRQVLERIKQHSLLSSDTARGQGIGFDHEDFQNFYLGEGLGSILGKKNVTEIRSFLAVNLVPMATVEQALQYLVRYKADLPAVLDTVVMISNSEAGYSFCKENCGALAIRILECLEENHEVRELNGMYFPLNSLSGRTIRAVRFNSCHFQPTNFVSSVLDIVSFENCEFERIELENAQSKPLSGTRFKECKVDSLAVKASEEQAYDPALIKDFLRRGGASLEDTRSDEGLAEEISEHSKVFERFLRAFLRHTHIDEEGIRIRLGKSYYSMFMDELLPALIAAHVLEQTPWRGQGVQMRFKLVKPMAEISAALERAQGDFSKFIEGVKAG